MKQEIRRAIEHLSGYDREHAPEAVEAVRALGALGVEALCAALHTPEALNVPRARHALKDQIARHDPDDVAPALLEALAHTDWRPNQVACDAVGLMKEAMIPRLIQNLESEREPTGRINTILILRRMDVSAAAPDFAKLARQDSITEVRAAAVEALGHLGAKESGPVIAAALRDESERVRLKAVKAAGWLRTTEAVDAILTFARAAEAEGRAAALYALDRIGDTRASAFAVECLKDPDPYVRWSAAVALRRLWHSGCEKPLEETLTDAEDTVAAAALETLCIAAPDRARDLLATITTDAAPALRRVAEHYRRAINPSDKEG